MKKKLTENSRLVYEYVKAHEDENITADMIAAATGLTSRSVNGIVTMAFQRNKDEEKNDLPLMERVIGEPTVDQKGKAVVPKYIKLTDEGRALEIEEAE